MTPEERKLYDRGYRAGRKRAAQDEREQDAEEVAHKRREDHRVQIYAAALGGLLSGRRKWSHQGETISDPSGYAVVAENITRAAMEEKPWIG